MFQRLCFCVVGLVSLAAVGRADGDAATALAASIQRHYDQVRDFQADFTHTYVGGILRKKTVERGRMAVRKPGRMRWTYTQPEEKLFVSDGNRVYSYVPADKQVYVAAVPTDDQATTPALFLAGKGNLVRDFTPSLVASPTGAPSGSKTLKLVPRAAQADFEWLMLFIEPGTLALRGLASTDAQGGTSTFVFNNVKENIGISEKLFEFKMPRGVELIPDGR